MGCESSKSQSNFSQFDGLSFNIGDKNDELEKMNCLKENENTMINRVWITKKSAYLGDEHALALKHYLYFNGIPSFEGYAKKVNLHDPIINAFNIEDNYNYNTKHWALILELSNGTYVNIQSGKEGFSLEEFNKTDLEGEAVLNAITSTWGEKGHPFSFCYLGYAYYEYDKLKKILLEKKNKEKKNFEEKGKIYYSTYFNNCQHFVCDIEKILFGKIKVWHSFKRYLNQFYKHYFRDIDINRLKLEYGKKLDKMNIEIFKSNIKNINNFSVESENEPDITIKNKTKIYLNRMKEGVEEMFSLKYVDNLN